MSQDNDIEGRSGSVREYWDSVARSLPQAPEYSKFGLLVAPYWGLERRLAIELALSYLTTQAGNNNLLMLKTDLWNEGIDSKSGDIFNLLGKMEARTEIVGIDVSQVICNSATKGAGNRELEVACADVRTLPFKDESVAAILDLSTLDHIPTENLSSVVEEYRRILKERGVLILIFDRETFRWVSHLRNIFNRLRGQGSGGYEFWWRLLPGKIKEVLRERRFEILNEFPLGILSTSPIYLRFSRSGIVKKYLSGSFCDLTRIDKFPGVSKYILPLASQYLFIARKQGDR